MKKFLMPFILTICFVVFTIMVVTIDVQPVGPAGSSVGFATLNSAVHNFFGEISLFYYLTQALGLLAIAVAGAFAVLGCVQLIKRKSLLKVDRCVIALGITYIVVIALYVLFEKLALNYRPVITDEGLEASYPSTHTMLILTIFGTARFALHRLLKDFKNQKLVRALEIACIIIMFITVIGRLICGVHWCTDILGSLLISTAIVSCYSKAI